MESKKESVRNWPFQPPALNRNFTLSPLEKVALASGQAQGYWEKGSGELREAIKQPLNRLVQPIEAALLHWEIPKGEGAVRLACLSLLLHEMQRRQTSLWAWDETAWIEIVGNTVKEFKSTHYAFEHTHKLSTIRYRQCVLACAYLLGEIPIYQLVTGYSAPNSAQHIFGGVAVEKAMLALITESKRIGRGVSWNARVAACSALLANRNPDLERLTLSVLEKLHEIYSDKSFLRNSYITMSKLLYNVKILPKCLPAAYKHRGVRVGKDDNLSVDWLKLLQAWHENSTASRDLRDDTKAAVAKAARWAAAKYPDTAGAHQWTRSMAIAFVAAVIRMNKGEWLHPETKPSPDWGQPIKAAYQVQLLIHLRRFFRDCHEWEWFPVAFNPERYFATPKSVLAKIGPNPRPIDFGQWARLREGALLLTEDDFPVVNAELVKRGRTPQTSYPLDMNRAMAIVWLYTGLRSDEIYRLRVGCIRHMPREENENSSSSLPAICLLTVPAGKSGAGFSKPVPRVVGDIIAIWEKTRPAVPKRWEHKTAEAVDFLFVWKGAQVSRTYLNITLIPALCRKAGIPMEDAYGKITSHRARHTLATQLVEAPTPMSGSDVQRWLGQRSRSPVRYYAPVDEHKLKDTYAAANQISIDKRQLEQLKNPETADSGQATEDVSASSVDLGHGFCTYDFYDQCGQRKPCDKCSFYKPKPSLYSPLQEVKSQLLHMLHHLPLSKELRQAVEQAIAANETLEAILRRNEENQANDAA